MAISSGQQIIGTSPSLVDGISPNPSRLHIHNMDNTKTLYLGNGNVTTANGLALLKEDTIELVLNAGESLYAVTDIGTTRISWLRQTQY